MRTQTYIVPLKKIQGEKKHDRIFICTLVNKGKKYPYSSYRQEMRARFKPK